MTTETQPRAVTITAPGDRDIRFERIFNAPRDLVWQTFTDPTLISEWWGGGAEVVEMDVRVGGTWKFLGGHMPDGSKFTFEGEYLEVDPPKRLVQTMNNGWTGGPAWTERMEFEDIGGTQTRFVQTSTFSTTEQRDVQLQTAAAGANFMYSRLDRVLARLVR